MTTLNDTADTSMQQHQYNGGLQQETMQHAVAVMTEEGQSRQ
jgi:hypothetical protein